MPMWKFKKCPIGTIKIPSAKKRKENYKYSRLIWNALSKRIRSFQYPSPSIVPLGGPTIPSSICSCKWQAKTIFSLWWKITAMPGWASKEQKIYQCKKWYRVKRKRWTKGGRIAMTIKIQTSITRTKMIADDRLIKIRASSWFKLN